MRAEGLLRQTLVWTLNAIQGPLYAHNVAQEDDYPAFRGPDGRFRPVEQVLPLEEGFIGGWNVSAPPSPAPSPFPSGNGANVGGPFAATPPPTFSPHLIQSGYPFIHTPSPIVPSAAHTLRPSFNDGQPPQLSAIERSQSLKMRRMNPYLQFMCGPLLRYDTVDERGVWRGAALIVSECQSVRPDFCRTR